jgi:hypothetical protein
MGYSKDSDQNMILMVMLTFSLIKFKIKKFLYLIKFNCIIKKFLYLIKFNCILEFYSLIDFLLFAFVSWFIYHRIIIYTHHINNYYHISISITFITITSIMFITSTQYIATCILLHFFFVFYLNLSELAKFFPLHNGISIFSVLLSSLLIRL